MRPFGAHISVSASQGGLYTALTSIEAMGLSAAQVFLGPPQTYKLSEYSDTNYLQVRTWKARTQFKTYVHAPYVLHAFAKPDNAARNNSIIAGHVAQAAKLMFNGYVIHMGGTKWYPASATFHAAAVLCERIGKDVLEQCPLLFENSASGNELSGDLEVICQLVDELRAQNYNVGICLDTLHAWAWGVPVMFSIESDPTHYELVHTLLHEYVQLIHLNSGPPKVTFGGHYDRHESIASGVISKSFFETLLNMHPEMPVVVERDEPSKMFGDWEFVKAVDARREQSVPV